MLSSLCLSQGVPPEDRQTWNRGRHTLGCAFTDSLAYGKWEMEVLPGTSTQPSVLHIRLHQPLRY